MGGTSVSRLLMTTNPHSHSLRLHRLKDVSATFFITKSLHPKKPILNRQATEVIVSAFAFAIQKERIYLRAFVVMPDHWHSLFALREPWTLPKFMHDLMSYIGAKTSKRANGHETSWQDRYYDTAVKTAKQFEYVAYYIEQNPVVKGLVERPEDWEGIARTEWTLSLNPGRMCTTRSEAVGAKAPPTLSPALPDAIFSRCVLASCSRDKTRDSADRRRAQFSSRR